MSLNQIVINLNDRYLAEVAQNVRLSTVIKKSQRVSDAIRTILKIFKAINTQHLYQTFKSDLLQRFMGRQGRLFYNSPSIHPIVRKIALIGLVLSHGISIRKMNDSLNDDINLRVRYFLFIWGISIIRPKAILIVGATKLLEGHLNKGDNLLLALAKVGVVIGLLASVFELHKVQQSSLEDSICIVTKDSFCALVSAIGFVKTSSNLGFYAGPLTLSAISLIYRLIHIFRRKQPVIERAIEIGQRRLLDQVIIHQLSKVKSTEGVLVFTNKSNLGPLNIVCAYLS